MILMTSSGRKETNKECLYFKRKRHWGDMWSTREVVEPRPAVYLLTYSPAVSPFLFPLTSIVKSIVNTEGLGFFFNHAHLYTWLHYTVFYDVFNLQVDSSDIYQNLRTNSIICYVCYFFKLVSLFLFTYNILYLLGCHDIHILLYFSCVNLFYFNFKIIEKSKI